MPYSTADEVREILKGYVDPQSSDPDVTAAHLTDAQIEYEIANVDAEINLVLARRGYIVPIPTTWNGNLVSVPTVIHHISIDMAAALSDMTYRGSKAYGDESNPFRLRYDRAKEMLERIAQGAFTLPIPVEGSEGWIDETQSVFNPYRSEVLLTEEVFPRGYHLQRNGAEYGENPDGTLIIRQPYRRY
jgi:hypothetical protein